MTTTRSAFKCHLSSISLDFEDAHDVGLNRFVHVEIHNGWTEKFGTAFPDSHINDIKQASLFAVEEFQTTLTAILANYPNEYRIKKICTYFKVLICWLISIDSRSAIELLNSSITLLNTVIVSESVFNAFFYCCLSNMILRPNIASVISAIDELKIVANNELEWRTQVVLT